MDGRLEAERLEAARAGEAQGAKKRGFVEAARRIDLHAPLQVHPCRGPFRTPRERPLRRASGGGVSEIPGRPMTKFEWRMTNEMMEPRKGEYNETQPGAHYAGDLSCKESLWQAL